VFNFIGTSVFTSTDINRLFSADNNTQTIFMGLTRLVVGLHCLPRLQEIVVSVSTSKIMVLHDELKT
jgi:hypothetical protein